MHPILQQTMNNGIILLLCVILVGFLLKGFFFKYLRVKMSFGKLVLVKVRAINRDHYKIGQILEGFLIYKMDRSNIKRLAIEDNSVFYRCMGVNWVDVDEQKNALTKADYSTVSGYDAVKSSDLLKRALYKPQISEVEKLIKLILFGVLLVVILVGVCIFFIYTMNDQIGVLQQTVGALQSQATIIPSSGL